MDSYDYRMQRYRAMWLPPVWSSCPTLVPPSGSGWPSVSERYTHLYIYTVQLLVLRRRFINHYSFNSILYFMKKGHSMSGCYCSECLLATKNWSFKLFSFFTCEAFWVLLICIHIIEMVSLGLLKCWEISIQIWWCL